MDEHRVELIQGVTMVAPILDKLLQEKVITKEGYANVRSKDTSQNQMREMLTLLNTSASKDIFYDSLKKEEKLLAEELEKPMNQENGKWDSG